jgi:hypothetical protein
MHAVAVVAEQGAVGAFGVVILTARIAVVDEQQGPSCQRLGNGAYPVR